ncbi:MAG: hypothetical protein IPO51_13025 [Dehalococcoidia bacterium]|nr:hypothetical protein [Dehalococcoidia bacterium]
MVRADEERVGVFEWQLAARCRFNLLRIYLFEGDIRQVTEWREAAAALRFEFDSEYYTSSPVPAPGPSGVCSAPDSGHRFGQTAMTPAVGE